MNSQLAKNHLGKRPSWLSNATFILIQTCVLGHLFQSIGIFVSPGVSTTLSSYFALKLGHDTVSSLYVYGLCCVCVEMCNFVFVYFVFNVCEEYYITFHFCPAFFPESCFQCPSVSLFVHPARSFHFCTVLSVCWVKSRCPLSYLLLILFASIFVHLETLC